VKSIATNGSVQLEAAPSFGLKLGSRYMMVNGRSLLDVSPISPSRLLLPHCQCDS
jgi:hypothetical protein